MDAGARAAYWCSVDLATADPLGFIIITPGIWCSTHTSDCLSVFFWDENDIYSEQLVETLIMGFHRTASPSEQLTLTLALYRISVQKSNRKTPEIKCKSPSLSPEVDHDLE